MIKKSSTVASWDSKVFIERTLQNPGRNNHPGTFRIQFYESGHTTRLT